MSRHRDLGPRYLAENTSNSAANQLRTYGVGLILGLAAVGYVQAALLMGPFMVIFLGMSLVPCRRPPGFCVVRRGTYRCSACWLAAGWLACARVGSRPARGAAEGARALAAWPDCGGPPSTWCCPHVSVMGACVIAGAGAGLHALGAARRSMRAMVLASVIYLVCGLAGAQLRRSRNGARRRSRDMDRRIAVVVAAPCGDARIGCDT